MVQAIGRHRVACNSIEDAPHRKLLEGNKARVLYTDPPWSDRMMSFFDTLQEKQTNEGGDGNLNVERMVDELGKVIQNHVDGYVFVYWTENNNIAQNRLDEYLAWSEEQYPLYTDGDGNERKYVLYFGATSSEYQLDINVNGMNGLEMNRLIFDNVAVEDEFAYDPMCGQGNSAVGSIENGMRFAGNELNRKRVNDCVDRIKAAEKRWESNNE